LSGGKNKKSFPTAILKWDSGRKECGSWYGYYLSPVILAKVGTVFLHLIREGLLRATELSGDSTVGDAFRVILPKLDNGIGLRVEFTQRAKSCSRS
jgi:hypothetical protein